MSKRSRYSPEVRERAVRLVVEHAREHASQWAAITSIASKIGFKSLSTGSAPRERDEGGAPAATEEQVRVKAPGVK
jgi:transposase